MQNSNFVWTDLSTFEISATQQFYAQIFGWQYHDNDGYLFGYIGDQQSAGIYTMPEKFQQIGMPSFWMSYISVTDIETVVAQSEQMGARIEIGPTPFGEGQIALIRDPSGAGFTVWEGPDFAGKDHKGTHGRMVWHELYVSDAALVIDFYPTVFGWSFTLDGAYAGERYDIRNGNGTQIGAMEVIPNEVKGKEEFWVPYFAVQDLDTTLALIEQAGGQVVDRSTGAMGNMALARDPQQAAFALMENSSQAIWNQGNVTTLSSESVEGDARLRQAQPTEGGFKWRTLLALALIYVAVLFDLQWVWGLLFLLWLIPDIVYGEIHLVEQVRRDGNPIIYWLVISTWLWMSIYLLATPFLG